MPLRDQPRNVNLIQTTQYLLNFDKIPSTTYFCQSVTIPGVNMSEAAQPTPFVDLYRHGDKLIYDPLTVTFLVDEWITSWKNIHDWMRGLTFPTKFPEYQKQKLEGLYSDATLTLLNGLNNPVIRIVYRNCFPTTLSPITMSSTDDGGVPISADATFRYDYFDIFPLHK